MRIQSLGVSIGSGVWTYNGILRATKDEAPIIAEIFEGIRHQGFAVTRLPDLPTKFCVFDAKMDIGDLRVYSADRGLTAFRKARKRVELGTKGDYYQGEREKFIGEIEIRSKEEAAAVGIDDYDGLLHRGFSVSLIRGASAKEFHEKRLLRTLRKGEKNILRRLQEEMVKYGCKRDELQDRKRDFERSYSRKSI